METRVKTAIKWLLDKPTIRFLSRSSDMIEPQSAELEVDDLVLL